MNRAFLPFRFLPSAVLVDRFGKELFAIAVLAVRAVLKHRKSLEIAHQQIIFRDTPIALSTRISETGDVIVDLDIGDPNLANRIILEDELLRAAQSARTIAGPSKSRRSQRMPPRR